MAYLTIFHWGMMLSATYTYGSKIDYSGDGSVLFSNIRQAPGTPLHYWQNLHLGDTVQPHDQFPLLKRGQTYAFQMSAQVDPEDSVAVNIVFLDDNNHIIDQHLVQSLTGSFTMPEIVDSYRIELLNINNKQLHFFAFYLSEIDAMRSLEIEELLSGNLLHVHDYTKPVGREMVVLRHRVPTEIIDLGEVSDQYYLRVPARILDNDDGLHKLMADAYRVLHLNNASDLNWRAMTSETEKAVHIFQNFFRDEK